MRSLALKAALATAVLAGSAAPALAYYPDDHVWEKEYQSGVEWNYPVHRKAVPWVSSVAWRERYPTAPAWWQSYAPVAWNANNYTGWYDWRWDQNTYNQYYSKAAAIPTAYLPVSNAWTGYSRTAPNAWDTNMAWNVAWWDRAGAARPLTNAAYQKAVFDSAQNPFSDTRLNNELQVAAAYGDVARVKYLVGTGADIHARDWEGYTPLTWAAQHGRREVVDYLLSRYAQPNAVDRWGYTPLMWAVQQGHTDVAAMLLAKGANPRTSTPYGVTPQVLATYAAGGRSRSLIETALAGRKIDYNYYKNAGMAQAPQAGWNQAYAAPAAGQTWAPEAMAQAAGAQAMAPQAAAAPMALASGARLDATVGWTKLAALAADFGVDFKGFLAESTSGGIGLQTLTAFTGGDMEVGKDLSLLFTNMVKDRDLKKVRTDLESAKPKVKPTSRFAKYVTGVDETMRAMGF